MLLSMYSYLRMITSKYEPEIPGRIIALMAITPVKIQKQDDREYRLEQG